jgi:hypothetical protein
VCQASQAACKSAGKLDLANLISVEKALKNNHPSALTFSLSKANSVMAA